MGGVWGRAGAGLLAARLAFVACPRVVVCALAIALRPLAVAAGCASWWIIGEACGCAWAGAC
eukprot:912039-Heterocapsa_arctica.AAC.1